MSLDTITKAVSRTTANGSGHDATSSSVADWHAEQVRLGKIKVHTVIANLTPALAAHLLAANEQNRPVSMATVERYASDLQAGNWELNGEPIIVSKDGKLNDGQHRCHAVIASGKSPKMLFVYGISRDSRLTLDTGKARSAGDFIRMSGGTPYNANAAAGAALLMAAWRKGIQNNLARLITKKMVQQEYWNNEEVVENASKLILSDWTDGRIIGGPSVHIAAFAILTRFNPHLGPEFVRRVVTGADLRAGDGALVVRNWMIAGGEKGGRKLEAYLRGWNLYRTKKFVKRVVTSGSFPEFIES